MYVNKRIEGLLDVEGWIALREKMKQELEDENIVVELNHKKDIESSSKKQFMYVNKRIADSLDEAGWIALRDKWKKELDTTNLAAQSKHIKDIESPLKKQPKKR